MESLSCPKGAPNGRYDAKGLNATGGKSETAARAARMRDLTFQLCNRRADEGPTGKLVWTHAPALKTLMHTTHTVQSRT